MNTLYSHGRVLGPQLFYFEFTSDLTFKTGGTEVYGDALPLKYNTTTKLWDKVGSLASNTFKVYDPSLSRFAAQGERGVCTYQDKRFVLLDVFSTVAWFPIKAYSGTVPGYSIAKVQAGSTVLGKMVLTVAQPDTTFSRFYAITSPQGINAVGDYSVATWQGPAEVSEGSTSSGFTYKVFGAGAGPYPGQWGYAVGGQGLDLLHQPASKWICRGRYPLDAAHGKTVGAINKGSSGSVYVYWSNSGTAASTGMTLTAYNAYGNVSGDKWVDVEWRNNSWYLVAAEC